MMVGSRSLGRDDGRVLRHIPGAVDFAFVINLYFDFDFAADRTESAKLPLLRVVMCSVELSIFAGQLYRGDDQMILLIRRSVSPENESVEGIVFALRSSHVRQPLDGQ